MYTTKMSKSNWRDDAGISSYIEYKKRFAIFPILCHDGVRIWLKNYYKKYEHWSNSYNSYKSHKDMEYCHTDFIENITEAEYIVRKLTENL